MFGKPEWFVPKTWGWGIHPVTWQGWGWLGAWLGVMLVPYIAFLNQNMWTEGFIWLGAMILALVFDVWQILSAIKPPQPVAAQAFRPVAKPTAAAEKQSAMPDDGILFLGEPAPTGRGVGTKKYDFQMRK